VSGALRPLRAQQGYYNREEKNDFSIVLLESRTRGLVDRRLFELLYLSCFI
jgi:hypothetical protein